MQPQLKNDQQTQIPPALLEDWMREFYFDTEIDIGSSGVSSFSMGELREILGFTQRDLDQVLFQDSRTLGDPALREAIARTRFGCPRHMRLGFGATTSEFEAGLARLSAHLETFS